MVGFESTYSTVHGTTAQNPNKAEQQKRITFLQVFAILMAKDKFGTADFSVFLFLIPHLFHIRMQELDP